MPAGWALEVVWRAEPGTGAGWACGWAVGVQGSLLPSRGGNAGPGTDEAHGLGTHISKACRAPAFILAGTFTDSSAQASRRVSCISAAKPACPGSPHTALQRPGPSCVPSPLLRASSHLLGLCGSQVSHIHALRAFQTAIKRTEQDSSCRAPGQCHGCLGLLHVYGVPASLPSVGWFL